MLFSLKKKEPVVIEDTSSKDLALINQLNQELAKSIELKETLENALEVIIKRINAQAANVFMIEEKKQVFLECTETIKRQVNNIQKLVSEFSNFARMPSGKFKLVKLNKLSGISPNN